VDILLIILGIGLLYAGGEFLVSCAIALGRTLGMSSLLIGLTIISFGTSAPELASTLVATLSGVPAIGIGNVIGSNVTNLGCVLGLVALFGALPATRKLIRVDTPFMVVAGASLMPICRDGVISQLEAGVLFCALMAFLVYHFRTDEPERGTEEGPAQGGPIWKMGAGVLLGLVLLAIGAEVLIDSATRIARDMGISERVIGLTLVAIGTSLPELASSIAAATRRESDLILGNVIGSNIFNVLAVLGITGMIEPILVDWQSIAFDVDAMTGIACLTWLFLWTGRKIHRWQGAVLVVAYAAFLIWI